MEKEIRFLQIKVLRKWRGFFDLPTRKKGTDCDLRPNLRFEDENGKGSSIFGSDRG